MPQRFNPCLSVLLNQCANAAAILGHGKSLEIKPSELIRDGSWEKNVNTFELVACSPHETPLGVIHLCWVWWKYWSLYEPTFYEMNTYIKMITDKELCIGIKGYLRQRKGFSMSWLFFFNLYAGGHKFWKTWKFVITLNYINWVYVTRFGLFDLTCLWVKVNPLHIFDLQRYYFTMNLTANITLACACWITSAPLHHLQSFSGTRGF